MRTTITRIALVSLACLSLPLSLLAADAIDPLAPTPTLKSPPVAEVEKQVMAWLGTQQVNDATRTEAAEIWKQPADSVGPDLLERLAATAALGDSRARALFEICTQPRTNLAVPEQGWLASDETPPLIRHNLRLFYARWLSHQQLYDEMLDQLSGLEPTDVVDPGSLLFYQSVAYHRLLKKKEGLKTLERLTSDVIDLPARFRSLAALMQHDLTGLDEKTLDHIARRMEDIRRQLDLGRAGDKVVRVEDGVIESLDKLIKEMEDQAKQQQQQSSGGSASAPSAPMQDSKIAPLKGPGDVDHRRVGNTAGWGDLPAKQREEALQQIGKDFPSHYRDAIEQYFRKLAAERSER